MGSAEMVPERPYTGVAPLGLATGVIVSAHCEVLGRIAPTSDSDIRFMVWLPATKWNGKYRQEGNSGLSGTIPVWNLIDPLRRGYASAATDDGHQDPTGALGAAFAVGHPEKLVDYGHRAVHETAERAKAIISAFYGQPPSVNYFAGCSTGGRQALMEAQRYPDDFQGIIAAAPAPNYSGVMASHAWNQRALLETAGSYIPVSKLAVIQRAVRPSGGDVGWPG